MTDPSREHEGHGARNPRRRKSDRADKDVGPSRWVVVILEVAKREGHKILSDLQYDHIVEILKRLVDFSDRQEIADLDIERIQSFYELREKGGVLGRINLRVYFGTIPTKRELVVVKAYKKEDDGPLPRHIVIVVEDRLEEYRVGGLRKSATVYQDMTAKE